MFAENHRIPCWLALTLVVLLSGCGAEKTDDAAASKSGGTAENAAPDAATSVENAPEETAAAKEGAAAEEASVEEASVEDASVEDASNEVLLGSPELTAGIPGKGPLTADQIKPWIDDPKNHAVLIPQLPLGLSRGQAGIKGLDKNPLTRAKIELGRQLYFDTRLSADNTVSCADCHDPGEGYARHTQFGVGIAGQKGGRNSPVSYNRILSDAQFWDGRAGSLEEQAVGPIENPIEMGNTHEGAVKTIEGLEGYVIQFVAVFGDEGVTIDNVGRAIASFERVIVSGPSPYDYWEEAERCQEMSEKDIADLKEDAEDNALYERAIKNAEAHPISESALRGRALFFDEKKTDCKACHAGANFTDEQYHNLGIGMDAKKPDLGRFEVTKADKDRGAFKTPTLRNVELSAPYMHDGSLETLEEVVELYAEGGRSNDHLSAKIKMLELTDRDQQDLVAFMRALTSAFPKVETGRLPE